MRRSLAWAGPALLLAVVAGIDTRAADNTQPAKRTPQQVAADIDKLIGQRLKEEKITPSPQAEDAEFLRRVYLDITGKIPTANKAREFLDSKDASKRSKLIDELLASKEYGRHFAVLWRDLMVRPDANQIRPPNTEPLVKWL